MDNRPTIAEVQEWVLRLYNTCEQTITDEERKEQHKYAIMVQRPQDKKFLVKMLDESSQIRDRKKLAERIKKLIDRYGVPEFLNKRDAFLFKMYQAFGYHFDFIAIPIIKKRLRSDTSKVILDEARPQLTEHLATRFRQKIGQNVTCWGRSYWVTEKLTIVIIIIWKHWKLLTSIIFPLKFRVSMPKRMH